MLYNAFYGLFKYFFLIIFLIFYLFILSGLLQLYILIGDREWVNSNWFFIQLHIIISFSSICLLQHLQYSFLIADIT